MENPINFLTARGDDLFDYFYSLQTHYATSYRAIAILRDEIAAAVEAKVRGECAADIEAIRCKYDEAVADFLHAKARAERAEAERDEAKKDAAMWKDIADMNYRGFKREKAKIADAIIALSAGDGGGEP
jgi:hypothetical protein